MAAWHLSWDAAFGFHVSVPSPGQLSRSSLAATFVLPQAQEGTISASPFSSPKHDHSAAFLPPSKPPMVKGMARRSVNSSANPCQSTATNLCGAVCVRPRPPAPGSFWGRGSGLAALPGAAGPGSGGLPPPQPLWAQAPQLGPRPLCI